MIRKLILLAVIGLSSLSAADDGTTMVITPGHGRIEIVSDYILFSSGKSYDAKIPNRIKKGTRINIMYKKNDRWVRDTFDVVRISTEGKLCRLHSKTNSRFISSPGDTIYVNPCRYK